MTAFTVAGSFVSLAVETDGHAVTRIRLNDEGERAPAGAFERNVSHELQEYLAGARRDFTFPISPQGTPFQRSVWGELQKIPYGQTTSYGEIAARVKKPGGARAVGMANNRNPIPLVIPCHRVVAAGGKLGGFGGGLTLKRRLLDLETSLPVLA